MKSRFILSTLVLSGGCLLTAAAGPADAYIGRWALTIPGGGAGWLGVTQEDGYLDASILWGGGSVVPVDSVFMDGDTLCVTRNTEITRRPKDGQPARKHVFSDLVTATATGDTLALVLVHPGADGTAVSRSEFTGKRIPDLPPAPDLKKVKYGKAEELLNGKDLGGWRLLNPDDTNGWSILDGALVNDPKKVAGKHLSYGNIRTDKEFEDFNLSLEVSVPAGGNSGVYLRGIYEVQVLESYGKPVDSHNMGAIYSRITPSEAAEKKPGEWQTLDITLVDRHVTVILNGKKIIDNQPLLGCTGGAMWSDESKPGPIYLQGDHDAVKYRNMVLKPVVKS